MNIKDGRNKSVDFGGPNRAGSNKDTTQHVQQNSATAGMSSSQRAHYFMKKYNDKNGEIISVTYLQIKDILDSLNDIHDSIMQNHEKDFLNTYKDHMVKVQCELIHFKKKSTDFYFKMKKDERLKFLEQTINWFRNETMSLAKSIQHLKENNQTLKEQLDQAQSEKNFLKTYAKSSQKYNMVLKNTIEKMKDPENIKKYYEFNNLHATTKKERSVNASIDPETHIHMQSSQVVIKSPTSSVPHQSTLSMNKDDKSPINNLATSFDKANNYQQITPSNLFPYGKRVSTAKQNATVKSSFAGGDRVSSGAHVNERNISTAFSLSMGSNVRRSQLRQKYAVKIGEENEHAYDDTINISQQVFSHADLLSKHNPNQNEYLNDYYKIEINKKDKQINELKSMVSQLQSNQVSSSLINQQFDLQQLFLECVQTVKKSQFSQQNSTVHLTNTEKSQILSKFMTNKHVLSQLYDFMFNPQNKKLQSKAQTLQKPFIRDQQTKSDSISKHNESITLSNIEKEFLNDSTLIMARQAELHMQNQSMKGETSPYMNRSQVVGQDIGKQRPMTSSLDLDRLHNQQRFRNSNNQRGISMSIENSTEKHNLLNRKKIRKSFKVRDGKLLVI